MSGKPGPQINKLECVGDTAWANIWRSNNIVAIDPATGNVTAVVDASSLNPGGRADVLNGIAAIPGTDEFLVTGRSHG